MLAIIFAITTAICAIGWYIRWLTTMTMIYYMISKGCPEPTREELKKCTHAVIRLSTRKSAPDVAAREQKEVVVTVGKAETRVAKDGISLSVEGSQIAKTAWTTIHGMPQEPGQSG